MKDSLGDRMKNYYIKPSEIAALNWPARVRYGIADKETGLLVHSSDSERWVQAQFWRMELGEQPNINGKDLTVDQVQELVNNSRFQVVVRI